MASSLIPVGRHFLTTSDIDRLAATIPKDTDAEIIGKAGIDTDGARVAILFTPKHGHFVARTAFEYDWKKRGLTAGADIAFKFGGK
jgi:hypothetical protein